MCEFDFVNEVHTANVVDVRFPIFSPDLGVVAGFSTFNGLGSLDRVSTPAVGVVELEASKPVVWEFCGGFTYSVFMDRALERIPAGNWLPELLEATSSVSLGSTLSKFSTLSCPSVKHIWTGRLQMDLFFQSICQTE